MKFQLAINMERMAPDIDMRDVERHTLEMVQMADDGGFSIVWAAEHHALEMTIRLNRLGVSFGLYCSSRRPVESHNGISKKRIGRPTYRRPSNPFFHKHARTGRSCSIYARS